MQYNLPRGIVFLLIGEAFLALMAAMIKHLTENLPVETVLFFRNVFGLAMTIPFLLMSGADSLKTNRFPLHLIRGVAGVVAMYGYFIMLAHLPLAEATLVKLSSPLFLPIVVMLWLGDRISANIWLALFIGFIGVIFVVQPAAGNINGYALIGIVAAIVACIAKTSIRKMSDTEPCLRIVFYFGVIGTLVSIIPLLWVDWVWPTGTSWLLLLGLGIAGNLGQYSMTLAYQSAEPTKIAPYIYCTLIFSGLLGWLVWGESLSQGFLVGSLLVVIAGLVNIRTKPEIRSTSPEEQLAPSTSSMENPLHSGISQRS
ncbi:MAG: DMT family transporter [Pseudomonadota bacterium]